MPTQLGPDDLVELEPLVKGGSAEGDGEEPPEAPDGPQVAGTHVIQVANEEAVEERQHADEDECHALKPSDRTGLHAQGDRVKGQDRHECASSDEKDVQGHLRAAPQVSGKANTKEQQPDPQHVHEDLEPNHLLHLEASLLADFLEARQVGQRVPETGTGRSLSCGLHAQSVGEDEVDRGESDQGCSERKRCQRAWPSGRRLVLIAVPWTRVHRLRDG